VRVLSLHEVVSFVFDVDDLELSLIDGSGCCVWSFEWVLKDEAESDEPGEDPLCDEPW